MVNLFSHNWLIKVVAEPSLKKELLKYTRGRLLDVGCGEMPYRDLLLPQTSSYIGLEHPSTKHDKSHISVWGEACDLPFKNNSFDTALSLYVLEHLEDPNGAIREISRVLKQGGYCILTTVLFWHIHEAPRDFLRFTRFGLQYLFEKNNFEIIKIKPLTGFWVTFCQLFVYYLRTINFKRYKKKRLFWLVITILGFIAQCIGWLLNKLDKSHCFFGNHYITIGRKR